MHKYPFTDGFFCTSIYLRSKLFVFLNLQLKTSLGLHETIKNCHVSFSNGMPKCTNEWKIVFSDLTNLTISYLYVVHISYSSIWRSASSVSIDSICALISHTTFVKSIYYTCMAMRKVPSFRVWNIFVVFFELKCLSFWTLNFFSFVSFKTTLTGNLFDLINIFLEH